jgi:hypothetical protein
MIDRPLSPLSALGDGRPTEDGASTLGSRNIGGLWRGDGRGRHPPLAVSPVVLDVGSGNVRLLTDETYLGDRRGRTRDQRYGRREGALEAPALPAPGHGEFTAGRAE